MRGVAATVAEDPGKGQTTNNVGLFGPALHRFPQQATQGPALRL